MSSRIWATSWQRAAMRTTERQYLCFESFGSVDGRSPATASMDGDSRTARRDRSRTPVRVFIDSNIPMYFAGREHPNRALPERFLAAVERQEVEACTSAEVLHEILHRKSVRRRLRSCRRYSSVPSRLRFVIEFLLSMFLVASRITASDRRITPGDRIMIMSDRAITPADQIGDHGS